VTLGHAPVPGPLDPPPRDGEPAGDRCVPRDRHATALKNNPETLLVSTVITQKNRSPLPSTDRWLPPRPVGATRTTTPSLRIRLLAVDGLPPARAATVTAVAAPGRAVPPPAGG